MSRHIQMTQSVQYAALPKTMEARRREALRRLKRLGQAAGNDGAIEEIDSVTESFDEPQTAASGQPSTGPAAPPRQDATIPTFGRLSDASLKVMLETQEYTA
ncbi:MAG TPA: hypothetical protein VNT30_02680 [Stellaceae bacterium]|nr:hypothetical protein [Stellaceae bacterium]